MHTLLHRLVPAGFLALAAIPLLHGTQVPFPLPWNDASNGIVDLSSWNPPIGPESRVGVDTNGHFVVNNDRIRFLGMNFAGDSPFAPTNKADALAARAAKFGINCVRFHHMDAPWATGGGLIAYGTGSSRNFNALQLDRVLFLVSRLKAHGIYANINLLVGREFKQADGLPAEIESMDWKDQHIVGLFNDTALALHQEFATKLLTASNRYTGLTLAQDPAVAFVEIMNENGLIQKWFDGGLDRLPAIFAIQLQSQWNDWLAGRYADDAALAASWQTIDIPLGPNQLVNGNFVAGLSSWNQEEHSGADATFTVANTYNGQPAAQIQVVTAGVDSWHVQFNQPGLRLTNAALYTFSFSARASAPVSMDTSIMMAHDPWQPLGYARSVALTTNWQRFEGTFVATATDANARPNFGGFARNLVTVSLADVRLQHGGRLGILPGGISLANRNLPNVPYQDAAGSFTTEARRDWLRFLMDRERLYWTRMTLHLRDTCHYPGLIFGTITANSPASLQAELDVVDGHAYWQHPVFPGQPWDSVNWYVPNVSLVNTLGGDNTIAGLARQRVQGKPFTVTEYNHPSPNYYGAEGPLLLAAYGALQDWDGLWLFDYGPGTDAQPTSLFRGFFDHAQHPTKMANLRLAAALFRRGDLRPAITEHTMAVPPELELDTILRRGSAWNVMSGSLLNVPGTLALVNRLSLSVGPNAAGRTNPPSIPPATAFRSDTRELYWNLSNAGRGYVTLNSPNTKAILGFTDNTSFNLDGFIFRPGTTQLGWSTIGLSLTDGVSLTNAGSALLVAAGQVDNTAMTWKDDQKISVGSNWGRAPVLAEVVPFSLQIPVPAERVQAWTLNPSGQRLATLPVGSVDGQALLQITADAATIWFEIQVAPATPFDAWRALHFSSPELADPATSGENAIPADDNIQNLFKHALGLAPRPAATTPLFEPVLVPDPAGNRPGLAVHHAKTATDVTLVPEVSEDLVDWRSGPEVTELVASEDLGDHWRFTFADRAPLGSPGDRFLRLRADRQP